MLTRQALTIAIAAGILLIDAPPLIRRRLWGELATHAVLTLTATILVLLPTFGVEVPPLVKWFTATIRPVGKALFGWLYPV